MPIDHSKYPPYWRKLSRHIRFVRAGNRCEWCGVGNGALIIRSDVDPSRYLEIDPNDVDQWLINGEPAELPDTGEFGDKWVRVVLTVAHIDHDKTNNYFSNLAALCQRCHLNHDKHQHARNAALTRAEKKRQLILEAGQLELFA
jgi:hypothetical protein